jgi:hypothetical protein
MRNYIILRKALLLTNILLLFMMVIASSSLIMKIFPINIHGDMWIIGAVIVLILLFVAIVPLLIQALVVVSILRLNSPKQQVLSAKISLVYSLLIIGACLVMFLSSININNQGMNLILAFVAISTMNASVCTALLNKLNSN